MKSFKRLCFRIFTVALVIVLSLALLEGLCSVWTWFRFGTVNVERLNALDQGNAYVSAASDGYLATLMPDPYLGNRHNSNMKGVNNVGLLGPDFPMTKDPSKFTILLVGGSVAAQLGESGQLERVLAKYDFGKPVAVLDAALGGWSQPRQTIALAMYGDLADAVVDLSGFNERQALLGESWKRLEHDSGNFASLNPTVEGGFERVGAAWQTNSLRQFSRRHDSRALFFVTKLLRQRIEASVKPFSPDDPALSTHSVYRLPLEWPKEKCIDFNLAQARKYYELMDAMAGRLKLRVAFFVQPCPAIDKTLTDEERKVVGKLDYGPDYQRMADQLPAVSLLNCFEGERGTVYIDAVHNNDAGKKIMAERMAAELARRWDLKTK